MPAAIRSATQNAAVGDVVVAKPAGTVEGDVLVAFVFGGAYSSIAAPAGWTLVGAASRDDTRGSPQDLKTFTRVAGPSEPSSYTFQQSSSWYTIAHVICASGADTASPVDGTPATAIGSASASAVAPSISPAAADSLLICADGWYIEASASSIAPPSGMTEATERHIDNWNISSTATQQLSAVGATGTRTFTRTGGGTKNWTAVSIAIASASTGGAVDVAAAFVLPAPTLSATADVDVDAAAAFQLPAPTLAATVQVPVNTTATFTLPAPTLAAAADLDLAATAAFELPAPTLAAAVTTGETATTAAAAFVLPAPTLAGAGDLDVDTTAAFALAAPTLSATVDTPADITASFGLPAPTLAATGDLDLAAAANYALPTPQLAATADVDVDATATLTLPAPTLAATIAGVAIVPALERTYPIRAELRVVPLPTETRTYPVAAEPRTYAAIPE